MKVDEIDHKLLSILQSNSRASYATLSKAVGLTSTAVAQRVQRLIDGKIIIGFETKLNLEYFNVGLQAVIKLKLNFARIESFSEVLKSFEEIESCFRITGEDCLIMKVNLIDNKHLLEFINALSAYGTTTTHMIIEQLI